MHWLWLVVVAMVCWGGGGEGVQYLGAALLAPCLPLAGPSWFGVPCPALPGFLSNPLPTLSHALQVNMVGLFEAFSRLDGGGVADWVLRFSGEDQVRPHRHTSRHELTAPCNRHSACPLCVERPCTSRLVHSLTFLGEGGEIKFIISRMDS